MTQIPEHTSEQPVAIGEAARITGVSTSTLRRWERDGLLSPLRTPAGVRRYSPAALRAMLTQPKTTTAPAPPPPAAVVTTH